MFTAVLKLVMALLAATFLGGMAWGIASPMAPDQLPAPATVVRTDGPQVPIRTDLLGDPLPPGAVARIGTQRYRLGSGARGYSVAYSPNGKFIAAGGSAFGGEWGSPLVVFEAATGKAVQRLRGHAHVVRALGFSADSRLLASGGGDAKLAIWDVANGQQLWLLDDMGLDTLTFLGNSKTLAADVRKGNIGLVDASTGKIGTVSGDHKNGVLCIAASADGKLLAYGGMDETIRVWDPGTGQEIKKFAVKKGALRVHLSQDGKLLACSNTPPDGAHQVWNLETGQLLWRVPTQDSSWRSVGFSPDGSKLYTLGRDLRVLNTATGKELWRVRLPFEMIPAALAPDGRYVACLSGYTGDSEVRLLDLRTGAIVNHLAGHGRPVVSLAFSPDGKSLAATSDESTVGIWDTATGQLLRELPGPANGIAWSGDGRTIATSGKQMLRLWDAGTGATVKDLSPKFVNDKSIVPGGGPVAFLADNRHLAFCDRRMRVGLWDCEENKPLADGIRAQDNIIRGGNFDSLLIPFAAAADSGIIAVDTVIGRNGPIVLWDSKTGKELLKTTIHGSVLAISPKGERVAVDTGAGTELLNGRTGKRLQTLPGVKSPVVAAFSRDGRMLATASGPDGAIQLWETASGRLRDTLVGHGQPVRSIAFSPDSSRLATGSDDTTVLIWDLGFTPN